MYLPRLALLCVAVSALSLGHAANPPSRPLPPALASKAPENILPEDLAATMQTRFNSSEAGNVTATWSGTGAERVLRIEVPQKTGRPDGVTLRWPFRVSAKKDDVVLARILARSLYARQESGESMIQLAIQQENPVFIRHLLVPLTTGTDWTLLEVALKLAGDATPEQGVITLSFGGVAQAVEVASFEVLNFQNRATVGELPQTRFTYAGREPNAPWRTAALQRIQEIRTAPIGVRVVDATGQPVPDARVSVRLVRPQFLFGTAVASNFLLTDSPDGKKYRETLLEMFDTAVIENGMKWPNWGASPERRAEALRAAAWLRENGLRMRGHTLVWPGDKFTPRWITGLPDPRAEMGTLIREHIRDLMTATKGMIVGWDVINEMTHEKDHFKYLPESEAVEWFKIARETDPHTKLFINEYGMLNSPRSPIKIAEYVALIKRLKAAGAPIDALGVQGHVGRQVRTPVDVLADLDLLTEAGIEIQITEFDINSPDEELQADYTRDFLIALYSHPAVTGFTKWGFWESRHWKPDAGMYRADWSEKPNAKVWRDLVRTQWLTKAEGRTGPDGRYATQGHLGEYEFVVTAGGKRAVQMRTLTKQSQPFTIQVP